MMISMVAYCFRLCRWYWLRDASVSYSTRFSIVSSAGWAGTNFGATSISGVLPRLLSLVVTVHKGENTQRVKKECATIRL